MIPFTIEPFVATRRDLKALFRSPTLVTDLIDAGWIKPIRPGKPGREALYDFDSARLAYERLKRGDEPQVHNDGGTHA